MSKFNFKIFYESVEKILDIIDTLEINSKPISTVIYGTHHLSRRGSKLYDNIFYRREKPKKSKVLLEVLNLSDGKQDLIDIANKKNFSLIDNKHLIESMIREKLIKVNKVF